MTHVDPDLVSAVQYNCDLSDARFAGNYTMCIYLLKMREFYRWRHGLELGASLPMKAVGEWVQAIESKWDEIENLEFRPLPAGGAYCDVFDDESINRHLETDNVVFTSGLGRFGKPIFCLAECVDVREFDGLTVYTAGREYARELGAPPAMIRGNRIYLRRQSLRRLLWETIEEWRWHRRAGPMERVYRHYGFDADFESALDSLLEDQIEQVLLHEKGEYLAGQLIRNDWNRMLADVSGTQTENVARAVRDCLADSISVLPALTGEGRPELLHFYFATLTPLRRELFPTLLKAYRGWVDGATLASMDEVVDAAREHFTRLANAIADEHLAGGKTVWDMDAVRRRAF